jgi:hypothetical protein
VRTRALSAALLLALSGCAALPSAAGAVGRAALCEPASASDSLHADLLRQARKVVVALKHTSRGPKQDSPEPQGTP